MLTKLKNNHSFSLKPNRLVFTEKESASSGSPKSNEKTFITKGLEFTKNKVRNSLGGIFSGMAFPIKAALSTITTTVKGSTEASLQLLDVPGNVEKGVGTIFSNSGGEGVSLSGDIKGLGHLLYGALELTGVPQAITKVVNTTRSAGNKLLGDSFICTHFGGYKPTVSSATATK